MDQLLKSLPKLGLMPENSTRWKFKEGYRLGAPVTMFLYYAARKFKDTMNSKQESANFIKAKVHT